VRLGFVEGGGGGAGAGGFCAKAGSTRSPIAKASFRKLRDRGCMDLFQGENVSTANLVGQSLQVKVNNVYKYETIGPLLPCYFASMISFEKAAAGLSLSNWPDRASHLTSEQATMRTFAHPWFIRPDVQEEALTAELL